MNDLLERIKRLFAPRPRPPEETPREATADRPPPEPAHVAPEPTTIREPIIERSPQPVAVEDLAEVRAALEAVADETVAQETVVEGPVAQEPVVEETVAERPVAEEPVTERPGAPVDDDAFEENIAVSDAPAMLPDTPMQPAARAGEALVLTLGTPPLTFTVAKTTATLGRGQENTIRLDDLSVSRRHARIAYRQGGYWLSDLGSMGGTWVDGTRLSAPRKLAPGEVIDIGMLRLTVGFAGGAPARATASRRSVGSEATRSARRRR